MHVLCHLVAVTLHFGEKCLSVVQGIFIKWGMNVRYDLLELDRWMAERVVTTAAPVTEKRRVGRPRKDAK